MEYLAKLEGAVLGFCVTEHYIDCVCGRKLLKLEKDSGKIVCQKEVFEKEGLARNLLADNGLLVLSDFCTLHVLRQSDYERIGKWQLGEDLTSDICGLAADEKTLYCSVRNGKMITVDRTSFARKEFEISDSSMWDVCPYDKYLLCGTVDGRLLLLDKATLTIRKSLTLGRQNIKSLCTDGEILYAAGQDKKLWKINLTEFAVKDVKRNVHKKMFQCVGVYDNMLLTVSYPCGEIAFWNRDTLEKLREISVPLKLSGCACIDGDKLYIASRNIEGIGMLRLREAQNGT